MKSNFKHNKSTSILVFYTKLCPLYYSYVKLSEFHWLWNFLLSILVLMLLLHTYNSVLIINLWNWHFNLDSLSLHAQSWLSMHKVGSNYFHIPRLKTSMELTFQSWFIKFTWTKLVKIIFIFRFSEPVSYFTSSMVL